MQRNILEYLENTAQRLPDKIAFANESMSMTFREVLRVSRNIGSVLLRKGYQREPVVIYMEKHPHMIAAFWGVVYSNCFYVPIDEEMPAFRIALIFQNLKPRAVICDEVTCEQVKVFRDLTEKSFSTARSPKNRLIQASLQPPGTGRSIRTLSISCSLPALRVFPKGSPRAIVRSLIMWRI